MIWNMKPDRIQFGPPIEDDGPWTERPPALTRSLEFEEVREAGLFLIYADYLPHAVYEFAAKIDAAIEVLRGHRFDHDGFEDGILDFIEDDLDFDEDDLDFDDDLDEIES